MHPTVLKLEAHTLVMFLWTLQCHSTLVKDLSLRWRTADVLQAIREHHVSYVLLVIIETSMIVPAALWVHAPDVHVTDMKKAVPCQTTAVSPASASEVIQDDSVIAVSVYL